MKIKVIESYFDKETGVSKVIIDTELGRFCGTAKVAEEDKEYFSSYAGKRYAELKAIINMLKYKKKIVYYQIKALNNCRKAIETTKDYDKNAYPNRRIRKDIYELKEIYKYITESIENIKQKIKDDFKDRVRIINKYKEKKEENGNN